MISYSLIVVFKMYIENNHHCEVKHDFKKVK